MLKPSSPRNCKMTFFIGRVFAECQILKKWNGPISWPEGNILINFCVNIDIDKIYPKRLRTDIFYRSRLCRVPNSAKWKWPYLLNCEIYCDEILHTHWYWQDVANEIVKWHLGLVEVLPRFDIWDWSRFCRGSNSEKKWNWPYPMSILV